MKEELNQKRITTTLIWKEIRFCLTGIVTNLSYRLNVYFLRSTLIFRYYLVKMNWRKAQNKHSNAQSTCMGKYILKTSGEFVIIINIFLNFGMKGCHRWEVEQILLGFHSNFANVDT